MRWSTLNTIYFLPIITFCFQFLEDCAINCIQFIRLYWILFPNAHGMAFPMKMTQPKHSISLITLQYLLPNFISLFTSKSSYKVNSFTTTRHLLNDMLPPNCLNFTPLQISILISQCHLLRFSAEELLSQPRAGT
jgi:hypothetical protein